MKLSPAIHKADNVYGPLCTAGYTIPGEISKAKAKDARSQWLSTEDFETNGEFCDEEDMPVAWFDYEDGQLHLGN